MTKISLLKKSSVLKKMLKYRDRLKNGEYGLQLVELNYNNTCNFACQHCYSKELPSGGDNLSLSDIRRLADQAHECGVWQWHLQGGEPLLWPDLEEIITIINPERFHFFITTNGWLLTREKASSLARLGVDKISVSIDSLDRSVHDTFRGVNGAFDRAILALQYARESGMQANINTCITHDNCQSQDVIDIVEFAKKNGYTVLFVVAAPIGAWAHRHDVLISEEDSRYLLRLKKQYPHIHRDLYPLFDFEWGCRTMNGLIYVSPDGDVFSCPFIQAVIGNVKREPLSEILQRGWRVRYFRDYNPKCLVGEDSHFITNILMKIIQYPEKKVDISEVFSPEDFYPE